MRQRILVVDDDWHIQVILQDLLESEDYEVDIAEDGLIALEKLTRQDGTYEIILLDLTMPRMDGLQLIETLHYGHETWPLPIIVLSGDHNAIKQAQKMGIRHTLLKPFDLKTLLSLVSEFSMVAYSS